MRPRAQPLCRSIMFALLGVVCLRAQVTVNGKVIDENGVSIEGARVELRSSAVPAPFSATSDLTGNFTIQLERSGEYKIRSERQGFFVFSGATRFDEAANHLQITLNHLQEFAESVDVVYSPPTIDPQEPSNRKQLNGVEILAVPYPAPQDLRNSLPLLQGVVQDVNGRLHFNGGATDQTNFTLDGFNVSDPVTGRFEARVNIEAVRSLDVESGRFSAEKGRGSAGSVDVKTKMGDDHWRFGATNFFPGVTTENGLHIAKWTPRVQVSGPVAKGRAWFHNGFDSFYDVDIISGLPRGQNNSRSLTTSNLTRFQVNLTPANILTGSFLLNYVDANRHGLSFLDPVETTTNRRQNLYMSTIKDQIYLRGGALLEFGFADNRALTRESPQGNQTYEISPFGRTGNYFVDLTRHTYRQQWISNVFLPTLQAHGSHQFKAGVDLQRSSFDADIDRHDYRVLRLDSTVARQVTFVGNRMLARSNFEISHYLQDRWAPRDGLLVEAGFRTDWDEVVRTVLLSPRLSVAYAPKWMRETKLAAGFGVFHDALSLGMISQHQDQVSLSTFFARDGLVRGPVETAFLVDDRALRVPRFRTLSLSIERKLPFEFYGKAGYTHKVGSRGFSFRNQSELFGASSLDSVAYRLGNWRNDRYDAFEVTIRRTFAGQFEWVGGYTRSRARSDSVIDFNLENPIFASQAPGPFSWDAPNRFLTWGWAPLPKRILPRRVQFFIGDTNAAYLVEYRTGFPFSVVNEEGFLIGSPNSRRLPNYFNVNLHFERKFHLRHYLWAWRFGLNNLTNSGNPNVVNNNIDSPAFLSYGRGQRRAFSVRLRFLGRR